MIISPPTIYNGFIYGKSQRTATIKLQFVRGLLITFKLILIIREHYQQHDTCLRTHHLAEVHETASRSVKECVVI